MTDTLVSRSYKKSLTPRIVVATIIPLKITFDPAKRTKTLQERGLDFADVAKVFADRNLTVEDDRFDYGEQRYITVGFLRGRMVMIVWTPRGKARHVISMRKTNDREARRYIQQMD